MKNKQNEVSQDGWKGEQNNTAQRLCRKHKKKKILKTIKLTENTDIRKAVAIHWREASDGQEHWLMHWGWLKSDQACTHNIGQYLCWRCSLWPWPEKEWRQALVEPLLSLPGVAWNVNEFLCETAQEGGSGLAVHISGFDCNWLKVVIVKKGIVFPAFGGLSISCYTAWYSGTDYVVTFCQGVHNWTVASHTRLLPLYQGFRIRPSGLLLSFFRPTGSRTEGRPMRVNDRMRMEFMAECLGKRPTFLMQERPWSPSLPTNFPQRHSYWHMILFLWIHFYILSYFFVV